VALWRSNCVCAVPNGRTALPWWGRPTAD